MYSRITLLVLLISLGGLATTGAGQEFDFFWSDKELNSGALNTDATLRITPGESGSLYLYNSTHTYDNFSYTFVDVSTSQPGVIEFVAAETLDFPISVNGTEIGRRWVDSQGNGGSFGDTGILSSDLIDELHAFTVSGGSGIDSFNDGTNLFLDEGYDFGADAFLFARIDFVGISEGSISIQIGPGTAGVLVNGMNVDPAFGGAVVEVSDVILGDVNLDGAVNLGDVPAFVAVLQELDFQAEADVNQDGLVNSLDIPAFVDLLIP